MERLEASVRGALRGAGVPDAGALADVVRVWPEAVGDAIARAAWPKRIARDGHPARRRDLRDVGLRAGLLADEILAKLAAAVGEGAPSAIRFSPGPVPAPPAPLAGPERAGDRPRSTPRRRLLADELTAAMTDEELRATIARAAAASLARAAADRRF